MLKQILAKSSLMISLVALSISASFFMVGCSGDSAPDEGSESATFGTRSYKLDPEAAAIQISISGLQMGSADAAKFQFLMRTLKSAGEFTSIVEKAVDGGVALCGVFAGTAEHTEIYDLIRSLQMGSKTTNLAAISASGCSATVF